MNTHAEQREEIETIRARKISLNLSDADVERISEKAGRVGLTVSELLQNFIGDLVDGTYTNGSDERMYANQWFERCWFSMDFIYENSTFLRFLLVYNGYEIEDAIACWQDINDCENSDDEDDYEIYLESKKQLDEMFSEFLDQLKDVAKKPTLKDSMEEIMKWWNERQLLDAGERYILMENVQGSSMPVKVFGKQACTVEGCFHGMNMACYRVGLEELVHCHQEDGSTAALSDFYNISADELECERLYMVVRPDDTRRVFGFSDEPDWNKMLGYYFGDVMTSSGNKPKYFIVDTSEKGDNDGR